MSNSNLPALAACPIHGGFSRLVSHKGSRIPIRGFVTIGNNEDRESEFAKPMCDYPGQLQQISSILEIARSNNANVEVLCNEKESLRHLILVMACYFARDHEHPEVDLRFPEVDLEHPEVDLRFPEVNLEHPEVDLRFPEVDLEHPEVDLRFPEVDLEHPEVDLRFPEVDLEHPEVDLRFPEVDLEHPEVDLRFPEVDLRFPEVNLEHPEVDLRFPEVDLRFPEVDHEHPEGDLNVLIKKRECPKRSLSFF